MLQMKTNNNLRIFGIFFIISTIVLLFLSRDSFLFEIYGRADSACFFMCGKAWMNGMIPYVDFSDSKGPFLWLIYGIGYLIDHYSYIGVFFLTIPALAFALFFLFKTAHIYLKSNTKAFIASILVLFAMFNPQIHNETRAETFCWPFITAALFLTAKNLNTESTYKQSLKMIACVGLCCCACLLCKFTIAAMTLIFAFFIFINHAKSLKRGAGLIGAFLGGLSLFALPFAIYMLSVGCFDDFINEYFLTTTQTVTRDEGISKIIERFFSDSRHLFGVGYNGQIYLCFLIVIILHSVSVYKKGSTLLQSLFPTVTFLWFLGISTVRAAWCYYYESCSPFAIFVSVGLLSLVSSKYLESKTQTFLATGAILLSLFLVCEPYEDDLFLTQRKQLKNYYGCSELAMQVESPRVVCFSIETGIGMTAHTLPACKYWFQQSGETMEMLENRKEAIRNHTADFAVIPNDSVWVGILPFPVLDFLKENGYAPYNFGEDSDVILYARQELAMPKNIRKPTARDVLFKRNIYKRAN